MNTKKNWHIIENYVHAKQLIQCVCGWLGSSGEPWTAHRKENAGTPAPAGFNARNYAYSPGMSRNGLSLKPNQEY